MFAGHPSEEIVAATRAIAPLWKKKMYHFQKEDAAAVIGTALHDFFLFVVPCLFFKLVCLIFIISFSLFIYV